MKKFFGLFFFFVLFGVLFDLIKYGADSGVYNEWFFVFAVLLMLIMCWLGVFFGVKYLQHNESQRNKELEKKSKFIRVYILVIQVWSVMATFDIMDYFLENNMLNKWYFFCLGVVLLLLGWGNAQLDNILLKPKKKRK